jgi:hypothetical protein
MAEYNLTPVAQRTFLEAANGLLKTLADDARLQIRDIRFTVTAARQYYSFERC